MCSATCCDWEFSTLDAESPSEGKVDRTPKEFFFTCALSQKRCYNLAFLFLVSNTHSSDQTANQNPLFIRSQKISTLSKWPIFGMRPSIILVLYCFSKFQHVPKSLNMFQYVLTRSKCFKNFKMFQYVSNCFKMNQNVQDF